MAPFAPYPMDGTVYDIDGSTTIEGATVIALNTTTGEKTSIKTDSSGDFILDLSNLASGYSDEDRIQITASYGSLSGQRCLSKRHTVDTAVGIYNIGNMVLHPGNDQFGTCYITYAGITSDSTARTVTFYDRTNDVIVFKVAAIANSSLQMSFGYLGQQMDGGFIRVYSSETAGQCYCSVITK